MKKYILYILPVALLLSVTTSNAQVKTPRQQKTDTVARKVIRLMNAHQPDSVYALTGENFRKQINPVLWDNIFKSQLSQLLPFTDMEFISSNGSVSKYKLQGLVAIGFYISVDDSGKIDNLLFQPYQEDVVAPGMTAAEKKTDTVARKVLALINEKQAENIYEYAGESFRNKIDAKTWKNIAETGIFPMAPLPPAIFVSSKNGVNKYKINQFQFILGLDETGKFGTLAIQPYKEDAVKADKVSTDNPLKTQLDSTVDAALAAYNKTKGNVGLSAAVYYKGKSYFYNYGEIMQGNGQLPTAGTIYDIGSITKTFTATLLAIAVKEGKVTLNTPITKFLPDSVTANSALKTITLAELSNHTSGLPRMPDNIDASITDQKQPYEHYDEKQMFAFLKRFKATRAPGAAYEYSNFAAGLLGVILERVYQQPYQQLVKKYILVPAGLTATRFAIANADAHLVAQGYDEQNQPVPLWKFNAFQAAGALKSTAQDMLKYGILQLTTTKTTLAPALALTHQVTFKNATNVVGLGWHYLPNEPDVLQHSGGTGGYRSMVCVNLKRNIVTVILTNNATTGDATGVELMEWLEKKMK